MRALVVGFLMLGFGCGGEAEASTSDAPTVEVPQQASQPETSATPTPEQLMFADFQRSAEALNAHTGDELTLAFETFDGLEEEPSYEQLLRNTQPYRGRPVVYRGFVADIQDMPNGNSSLRFNLSRNDLRDFWVETLAPVGGDIVARRRVRVYGWLFGSWSYRTLMGAERTIPAIMAATVVDDRVPARLNSSARRRLEESRASQQ